MRPIRLFMKAFGPYPEQLIDFRLFGSRSLFLIHGPTGAGKTTILDAISYALYGETSGDIREGKEMRSDYADPSKPTEVIFDFSISSEAYRVYRSPEQERHRIRGSGTTKQNAKATLYRRTGVADDSVEGTVIASRWSQVTEEVKRLLGFTSQEFRSVVMLPQGKFQNFLLSDSSGRELILETLFQTEYYRRIEEALKDEAQALTKSAEDLRRKWEIILHQASASNAEEVEELITGLKTELEGLNKELTDLRTKEKEQSDNLAKAREANRVLVELSKAREAIKALEEKDGVHAEKRVLFEAALKAEALKDVEHDHVTRQKEHALAVQAHIKSHRDYAAINEALLIASSILSREQAKESERIRAQQDVHTLESLVDKVHDLEEKTAQLLKAEVDTARFVKNRENLKSSLEKYKADIETAQEALEKAKENAGKVRLYELETDKLGQILQKTKEITRYKNDIVVAKKFAEKASASVTEIEARLNGALEEIKRLEDLWRRGQASVLANKLQEGVPCPVCGSIHHPFPAKGGISVPNENELEKARTQVDEFHKMKVDAIQKQHDFNSRITQLQTKVDALYDGLGEFKEKPSAQVEALYFEAKGHLEASKNACELVDKESDLIKQLKEHHEKLAAQHLEVDKNARIAEEVLIGLRATIKTREADVPINLRSTEKLSVAIEGAMEKAELLIKALATAQSEENDLRQRLAVADKSVETALEGERDAKVKADTAKEVFSKRLLSAGFASEDEYHSSCITRQMIDKLKSEIDIFDKARTAAESRLKAAESAAIGMETPDIVSIEANLRILQQRISEGDNRVGEIGNKIAQHNSWLTELKSILGEIQKADSRYSVIGRLTEVAAGKNPFRMTFQRYVLAALLDDVLVSASHRLSTMSRGRFSLQRALEARDARTASGLDIEVFDEFTGTLRGVKTLSGGECFLASLALALGLADVVQRFAGGIRLETVFIDEGFGNLDPDALDLAFQALTDIQRSGRLVGVISHVGEVKERIDVRIDVIPGRSGSKAILTSLC